MIFRIHGIRGDGSEATVDVECDSEAVARNEAVRHGLVNTTSVEMLEPVDDESDGHRPVLPRPLPSRRRGTHWGVAKAFELGFGFGLGLALAALVVSLVVGLIRLLLLPFS
jgi:hypothetical protein